MRWSDDALKEMERVPFFIRKMVKKRVEEFARRQGSQLVVPDHLEACRQRFMKGQDAEVKGYRLETCFGARDCTNRVLGPTGLPDRLDRHFRSLDLKAFLKERVPGPLKMHHEFRISISFCPNACSRPQIVDLGIIGAVKPAVAEIECSMCGACIEECRERALSLQQNGGPVIDREKCLYCGHCIKVCPTGSLEMEKEGFRILVGGKLGRHPQLAHELPGIFNEDETMAVAEKVADYYMSGCRAGERFGALISRNGLESLYRFINIPFRG